MLTKHTGKDDFLMNILEEMNKNFGNEIELKAKSNIREEKDKFVIDVAMPGIRKEDINIEVRNGTLIISGERKMKEEIKEENFRKVEYKYGTYSQVLRLPKDINTEKIEAKTENGMLEITIPKEEKEQKRIEVK